MLRGRFFSPAKLGFLAAFTFGLVQFLVIALYPLLSEATELTAAQVVAAFTLGSIGFIFASPFWGARSDRWGRLPVLAIGLTGLTLSFALLLLIVENDFSATLNLSILVAGRLLYGATASAIVTVVQAWWRDRPGDSTRHMITHSMSLNLGRVTAPILIWWAAAELSPVLWGLFIWCAILALLTWSGSSVSQSTQQPESSDVSFSFSTPLALALTASMFIGLLHSTLAIYLQERFFVAAAQSTRLMSQVLLVSGLVTIGTQFILRKHAQLSGMTLWWTGLGTWTVASLFFLTMTELPHLWMAITVLSIGIAMITPAQAALQKIGGQHAGHLSAMQTLGLTAGSALGVVVLQHSLSLGMCLFALCLALFMLLQRQAGLRRCCA